MVTQSFECPNCSAPLDYGGSPHPVIRCPYCQSAVVVPEYLRGKDPSIPASGKAAFAVSGDLFQPDQLAKLREIGELTRQGNKIEAIKLYREVFGTGLKESKEAVESLERGEPVTLTHTTIAPASWEAASAQITQAFDQAGDMMDVVQLVQSGQKERAAARYSESFHTSLEDARLAVQQISQGSSSAALSFKRKTRAAGGLGCLGIAGIVLFILLTVVAPVFFGMIQSGGPLEGFWARVNPIAFARVALSFGDEGSGPGLFDDPRSIAVDPSGNIYVSNYSDGRIQKFDSSGNYLLLWNVGANQYVNSIAADRSGNVYMVYSGDIWKYDGANGKLVGKLDAPEDPWFEVVDVTADGKVAAAVNTEDILLFDPGGNIVFSLAESGKSLSREPEGIEDITIDGVGNLYVLDDSEGTVFKYSPDGRLLARFGSSGDEPGQFRSPDDIAVDGQGRIYVSDSKGIQVFSNDGRYLDKFDVQGAAFGMEFDNQGNLWVVTNRPAVFKYRISGR